MRDPCPTPQELPAPCGRRTPTQSLLHTAARGRCWMCRDVQPNWPRGAVEGGFLEEVTQVLGFDSRIGVSQAKRHSQPRGSRTRGREMEAPCSSVLQSTQDAPVRAEEKLQGATGPGVLGPHLRVKDPLKSTRVRHHCADRGNGALESPALTAPGRCQHALAGPSALEREPAPRGPLWLDACSGYSLQV